MSGDAHGARWAVAGADGNRGWQGHPISGLAFWQRQTTASAPRDEYLQLLDELLAPLLALSPSLSPSLSPRGLQAAAPSAARRSGRRRPGLRAGVFVKVTHAEWGDLGQ